jgi:hypothetical protein
MDIVIDPLIENDIIINEEIEEEEIIIIEVTGDHGMIGIDTIEVIQKYIVMEDIFMMVLI